MAKVPKHDFTTTVGRLVGGSIYEPKTRDSKGELLVVKNGPNKGQPRPTYDFAMAIAKIPGQAHWATHPFFAPIWAFTHAQYPQGQAQAPSFSWKVTDGDSTVPNKSLKKPCDNEGYPEHWIIWFSSSTPSTVWDANGVAQITEPGAIKLGSYIQVQGDVTPNNSTESPGIYWNHFRVAYSAWGPEISYGPTVSEAKFGQGVQLPPGASVVPVGGTGLPPVATPPVPGTPIAPPAPIAALAPPPPLPVPVAAPVSTLGQPTPLGLTVDLAAMRAGGQWTEALLAQHGYITAAPLPVPAPLPPAGSAPPPPGPALTAPVVPNPAILAIPGAPVPPPPAVAPPPPAPAARQMTAKANGATYEQMRDGGWDDAALVQHGMMLA